MLHGTDGHAIFQAVTTSAGLKKRSGAHIITSGRADEIGTPAAGKDVDFIVPSRDITAVNGETICKTASLPGTYISGKCVYQAEEICSAAGRRRDSQVRLCVVFRPRRSAAV